MRLEDLIRKIRLSVVQITVMVPGHGHVPIGTGFLVGSGRYVVTAKHVVDAVPDGEAAIAGLAGVDHDSPELKFRGVFAHAPMVLLATDDENDVALLELQLPPGVVFVELFMENTETGEELSSGMTAPMKISTSIVREGMEIATSGFPLYAPSLVTTRGIVASTFDISGMLGASTPTVSYLCDVTAINGNSGGPVYRTSDGAVIGLCRAVKIADPAGNSHTVPLLVVTPIEHAVALMDSVGVDRGVVATKPVPPKAGRR